jgi:hypothetical protein
LHKPSGVTTNSVTKSAGVTKSAVVTKSADVRKRSADATYFVELRLSIDR